MVRTDDGGSATAVRDALKRIRDTTALFETNRDEYDAKLESVVSSLRKLVGEFGEIELNVSTNRIMHGDDEVYKSEARSNNLAFDMFRQGLRRINLKPGLDTDEVTAFMNRFSECRTADQIDEDFVTLMWQESTSNISVLAIDNYTEKIFMSEAEFVDAFRTVVDDIAPGLMEMDDEDQDDGQKYEWVLVDGAEAADAADLEQRKIRKSFESGSDESVRTFLATPNDIRVVTDQLIHLFVVQMMTQHSALSASELQGIIVRILTAYLEAGLWQGFADALRSLNQVFTQREALGPTLGERVDKVRKVVVGRDMADHIAETIDPEQTNFTAWARWLYTVEAGLTAPALLELINTCVNPAGIDWLKDLLRRQSTSSLDPWAERLRDPNPRIVIEVIDVITSSELGPQAKPLLLEALRHDDAEVRACALNALEGTYDQSVRQEMLPLLKDPDANVRRLVVASFLAARDRSVSPYLANIIKSGEVFAFSEDEQREIFEALAVLGGEAFFTLFRDQLDMEDGKLGRFLKRKDQAVSDSLTRRAAVSALSRLKTSQAVALIGEVKRRADLALAAHCDVVMRLANRDNTASDGQETDAANKGKSKSIENVEVGRHRMGENVLFTLPQIGFSELVSREVASKPQEFRPADENADVDQAAVAVPTEAIRIEVPTHAPDLGPNPLLGHADVLSPWDRIRLAVNPSTVMSERFQLQDLELVMGGATQQQQVAQARVRTAAMASRPPARIIERSKAPIDNRSVPTRPPAAPSLQSNPSKPPLLAPPDIVDESLNLDELLQDYVGDESQAANQSQPDGVPEGETKIESILSAYLDDGGSSKKAAPKEPANESSDDSLDDVLQSFLDTDLEE